MKITYFQRYHSKENVATANTMLLLSRLYQFSADKFFRFLKNEIFFGVFEPEVVFDLQKRSVDSVPDAIISQESFKIVVETKLSDWFYSDQLMRHLNSFSDEKHKVLITLAPELMEQSKKEAFQELLKKFNATQKYQVIHINTTFEKLANSIKEVIDDRDYEMQDVLEDYLNYCYHDHLIALDSWKYMRVQLASVTFNFNVSNNVYYDNADRGFRSHDYLGLYTSKSVRAVGKIVARIVAGPSQDGIKYEHEFGNINEERKEIIKKAIENGKQHGYDLLSCRHRYFFVEHFFETDFKKVSPRAPMGSRVFDLTELLSTEKLPTTEELAERLKGITWQ